MESFSRRRPSGVERALRRTLGVFDSTAIGIGAIVGAGIFVVTGLAAGLAGPALLMSLVIGAIIAGFSALSFAELARSMPMEGGGYEFAREMISPFAGFIAGWMWIASNLIVGAAVAIGFASYVSVFVSLPVNIIAPLACVLVTAANMAGSRESGLMNDILVVAKLSILALFVVVGISQVHFSNFTPFAPKGTVGILQGSALIFFAYAGFARITLVGEEVKNPEKTVPRAIIMALVISTIVYISVAFTAIGLVGYGEISSSGSPLADAASAESQGVKSIVTIGAIAATMGVLLTTLLGLSRISFAMARRKDLPEMFARLGQKTGMPYLAIVVLGAVMTIFASVATLHQAAAIANFAALLYYGLGNYSAFKLKNINIPRAIPAFGLVTCIVLLFFLTPAAWIVGGAVILAGVMTYLLRRRYSRGVLSRLRLVD